MSRGKSHSRTSQGNHKAFLLQFSGRPMSVPFAAATCRAIQGDVFWGQTDSSKGDGHRSPGGKPCYGLMGVSLVHV